MRLFFSKQYIKNLISMFGVCFQALTLVFIYKFVDVGYASDQLFKKLTFMQILQMLSITPIDQFIVYFSKRADKEYAYIIITIFYSILALLFSSIIFFVEREYIWLCFSCLLYVLNSLTDRMFNLKGNINLSCLAAVIPTISMFMSIVFAVCLSHKIDDIYFWYALVFLFLFASLFVVTYDFKSNKFFREQDTNRNLLNMIKDSFSVRIGQNIYAFFLQFFSIWVLGSFGNGVYSYFSYAFRSIVAIFSVSVMPFNKEFMHKILFESKDDQKKIIFDYLMKSYCLYIFFSLCLMFVCLFAFCFQKDVPSFKIIFDVFPFFLFCFFWYLVVIYESVFLSLLLVEKKRFSIIVSSIAFCLVVLFFGLLSVFFKKYLIFFIGVFLGQFVSFLVYRFFYKKVI